MNLGIKIEHYTRDGFTVTLYKDDHGYYKALCHHPRYSPDKVFDYHKAGEANRAIAFLHLVSAIYVDKAIGMSGAMHRQNMDLIT